MTDQITTVHCFWSPQCEHVVAGTDPDEVHQRMEEHYDTGHRKELDELYAIHGVSERCNKPKGHDAR
jgi:hypothetical protein